MVYRIIESKIVNIFVLGLEYFNGQVVKGFILDDFGSFSRLECKVGLKFEIC